MALSIPAGVSTIRGAGWPSRSAKNSPLTATAPSDARSTTSAYSTPYPKQPLAAMIGLCSVREPMRTLRSIFKTSFSIPPYLISREHGPRQARSHVMKATVVAAHGHDAAVAAAEAASHDALHGHLARTSVARGRPGGRGEHPFGPARVDHQPCARRSRRERPPQRLDDAAALPGRSVLRRQHELDLEAAKKIEMKMLGGAARAIEQRRMDAAF